MTRRILTLEQIQEDIRAQLGDPRLCTDRLAARYGVPVHRLKALFRRTGQPVSWWIWDQRLEGARRDLVDPAQADLPVWVVARLWGFATTSHFIKRFRRAYHTSPGRYRRSHLGTTKRAKAA